MSKLVIEFETQCPDELYYQIAAEMQGLYDSMEKETDNGELGEDKDA